LLIYVKGLVVHGSRIIVHSMKAENDLMTYSINHSLNQLNQPLTNQLNFLMFGK